MRPTLFLAAGLLLTLAGCPFDNKAEKDCGVFQESCGGICVDLASDRDNCGKCENACLPGLICQTGQCTCSAGETNCGGVCVATNSDPKHCGTCQTVCAEGQTCTAGQCVGGQSTSPTNTPVVSCDPGLVTCSGACVNKLTDAQNCGECGKACSGGQVCQAGVCTCSAFEQFCGGTCIPKLDNNNCGACGTTCTNGFSCASNGSTVSCGCTNTVCGTSCVDTSLNEQHCGACNNPCTASQRCFRTGATTQCQAVPAPSLPAQASLQKTYGLINGAGQPLSFPITSTIQTGTPIFECRTAAVAAFGALTAEQGWAPCDGATGTTLEFKPNYMTGPGNTPVNGMKRAQVRAKVDGLASAPSATIDYYVHSTLNGAARCPGPFDSGVTTATVFTNAAAAMAGSSFSAFSGTDLAIPKITIPFVGIRFSRSLRNDFTAGAFSYHQMSATRKQTYDPDGTRASLLYRDRPPSTSPYPEVVGNPTTDPDWHKFDLTLSPSSQIESASGDPAYWAPLRHKFEMNGASTMILVTREWPKRPATTTTGNACLMQLKMAATSGESHGSRMMCAGFVVTRDGFGACVLPNGTVAKATPYGWAKLLSPETFSPKCFTPGCPDAIYIPD